MKTTFSARAQEVFEKYEFHLITRGYVRATGEPVQSYRVTNPKDPRRSYVVTVGAVNGCSCVAFRLDGQTCKHLAGVAIMLPAGHPPRQGRPAALPTAPVVREIAGADW